MRIIKRILKYLLIVLIVSIVFFPLWIGKVPLEYLSFLIGKNSIADKYICKYSIQVSGDSMTPIISKGISIELNRCFEESDLAEGMVVLFGKESDYHLGIIRHILPLNPVIYKISNERPNERLQDIVKEEIVAISKDVDTGNSTYKPPQDLDSLVINPDEYVSELYLGKIPRGYGVEMAEIEKTNIFMQDKDKFCMVVVPKKELAFVETEIIDTQTKEAVWSNKGIVFGIKPNPNINCQDFGVGQGMLDLDKGNYRYRLLLNHQALGDIMFTVK